MNAIATVETHPIQVTAQVTTEFLADVLCTALEGGTGYWAAVDKIQRTEGDDWQYVSAEFHDTEAEGGDEPVFAPQVVDHAKLVTGITRILSGEVGVRADIKDALFRGVSSNDAGDIDADVADCIVQAAMFNEIMFG